ncbi:regulator of nucleoside diphosphate kinase [Mucilaginibacter pineti]|uniref:Regulator of nucleoside diphosphate kinase n=1 Tax=Mucilaginibacter pineti TaxID=1391627 RepID=A0A1G6XB76_9SPHI|nr:GreA/GreB family elongation factor [Mucilaginibacter pineti]SDD75469.1 regulator of nucleoside diphosphate kinase [Mucilaginibacter pineti]
MKTEQLTITQGELDLLKKHLKNSDLTDFNKRKLLTELESAQVVAEDELPEDAICLNAVVQVQEVVGKQSFIFQIVLPLAADIKKNKISIFAPIAIALLGYRKGARIQWEMPNGMQEFEILKVNRLAQHSIV